jgi:DNA (cytosine-5)-methyltransferase 1
MRIGSLFSGAGGLDIAVEEVFDGTIVWHSELDPAASKVLAHRWPGVPNHGDITGINWDAVEPIDILCGGWPCQPFSVAGKRKGIHDDRALWPYVAGAVRVLRPRIVVLENVSAVLTAGEFDRVANDLAESGYLFAWTCARASDVGAPHRRERLFVVATDSAVAGWQGNKLQTGRYDPAGERGGKSLTTLPTPNASDGTGGGAHSDNRKGHSRQLIDYALLAGSTAWGKYEPAIRRWEQLTRPAPAPTELNKNGNSRLSAAFSQWLMGWPANWVTDVEIGIPRTQQLRIIGNGVVPQQAEAAIRYLIEAVA